LRILLDAHLSATRIAEPLRAAGHDVRALQEERELDGLDDALVLELAVAEGRTLVTRDSRHFAPLVSRWAGEGRDHAGCILIWSLGHAEFGAIVVGIEQLFADRSRQEAWVGMTLAL
jgi:predicted nuclease of predicted toxin-antitoxin system